MKRCPAYHTIHEKLAEVLALSVVVFVKQVAKREMPSVRGPGAAAGKQSWRCWSGRDHGQILGAEVTYSKKRMPPVCDFYHCNDGIPDRRG